MNNYPKSMYIGKGGISVPFVSYDFDSLVILRKTSFREFAIPVENAEEFITDVNKRMKYAKQDSDF